MDQAARDLVSFSDSLASLEIRVKSIVEKLPQIEELLSIDAQQLNNRQARLEARLKSIEDKFLHDLAHKAKFIENTSVRLNSLETCVESIVAQQTAREQAARDLSDRQASLENRMKFIEELMKELADLASANEKLTKEQIAGEPCPEAGPTPPSPLTSASGRRANLENCTETVEKLTEEQMANQLRAGGTSGTAQEDGPITVGGEKWRERFSGWKPGAEADVAHPPRNPWLRPALPRPPQLDRSLSTKAVWGRPSKS